LSAQALADKNVADSVSREFSLRQDDLATRARAATHAPTRQAPELGYRSDWDRSVTSRPPSTRRAPLGDCLIRARPSPSPHNFREPLHIDMAIPTRAHAHCKV